jgi:hypothetical protein
VGKTVLLTEMIHNVIGHQKGVSIFCGIGERCREGEELYRDMKDPGVLQNMVMIFGQMNEPPGKLAYAQFEELETFSRFGARLDENTRKIIEHGQRIRACLKQTESEPVSVPEQIAILLALMGGLFDKIPLDKVREAEAALCVAAAEISSDVRERFSSADKLSDTDRGAILSVAKRTLAPFQPKANKP